MSAPGWDYYNQRHERRAVPVNRPLLKKKGYYKG